MRAELLRSAVLLAPSQSGSCSLISDSAAFNVSQPRPRPRPPPRSATTVACDAHRSNSSIPKLEPFSRSRIERRMKDPPLLRKYESELTDYCTKLEGDDLCSCWDAYFELKDLENEMAKEDVERFVRQAGGMKSLISCLHGITAMDKKKGKQVKKPAASNIETERERLFPVPDGLPKSKEEVEEEEGYKMPDSPFTRLLRTKGELPAWYSQASDHETD